MNSQNEIPRLEKRAENVTIAVGMSVIGLILVSLFVMRLILRKKAPIGEENLERNSPYRISQDSDSFSLHVDSVFVRNAYRYPQSVSSTAVSIELEEKNLPAASHSDLSRLAQSTHSFAATMSTRTSKSTMKHHEISYPLRQSATRLCSDRSKPNSSNAKPAPLAQCSFPSGVHTEYKKLKTSALTMPKLSTTDILSANVTCGSSHEGSTGL